MGYNLLLKCGLLGLYPTDPTGHPSEATDIQSNLRDRGSLSEDMIGPSFRSLHHTLDACFLGCLSGD